MFLNFLGADFNPNGRHWNSQLAIFFSNTSLFSILMTNWNAYFRSALTRQSPFCSKFRAVWKVSILKWNVSIKLFKGFRFNIGCSPVYFFGTKKIVDINSCGFSCTWIIAFFWSNESISSWNKSYLSEYFGTGVIWGLCWYGFVENSIL